MVAINVHGPSFFWPDATNIRMVCYNEIWWFYTTHHDYKKFINVSYFFRFSCVYINSNEINSFFVDFVLIY